MATTTRHIAPTLKEAREKALRQLPNGHEPVSVEVRSDGKPVTVTGLGDTEAESRERARAKVPTDGPAAVVLESVSSYTKRENRTFHSFGESFERQAAKRADKGQFGDLRVLSVTSGRKWSLLGLKRYSHTVELVGQHGTRVTYQRDAEVVVTSKHFAPPAEVGILRGNPFATLGLVPNRTSPSAVSQRAADLYPLVEFELDPTTSLDEFYSPPFLVNGNGTSRSDIDEAKSRLISDLSHLEAARFWFNEDEVSFPELATHTCFDEALAQFYGRTSTPETRYATALLQWYHNVARESEVTVTRLLSLSRSWKTVLSTWGELHAEGVLRERIASRAKHLTDPRIDDAFISLQTRKMLIDLYRPVVVVAEAARQQGFTLLAREYLRIVGDSGLPDDLQGEILDHFFGASIQAIRAAVGTLSSGSRIGEREHLHVSEALAHVSTYEGESVCELKLRHRFKDLALVLTSKAEQLHSVFKSADQSYYNMASHLVDTWNQSNDIGTLRAVLHLMAEHQDTIGTVRSARDECKRGLQELASIVEDAKDLTAVVPSFATEITDLRKSISEWSRNVDKEYNATKSHIERNLSGMRSVLDRVY